MRATARHPNPAGLRDALADGIGKRSRRRRAAQGLPNEQVMAARYILCTLLDESAASTPWGGSGVWSPHSLLVHVPQRDLGRREGLPADGQAGREPDANRDLLELIYVVLALGFEGRYRVIDNGEAQLEACASGWRRCCARSAAADTRAVAALAGRAAAAPRG